MNFDAQKSRANFCRFELKNIYIDAIEVSMQMIHQHSEDGFEKFYKEFTKNELAKKVAHCIQKGTKQ